MTLIFLFSNNYSILLHDIDLIMGNKIQKIIRKPVMIKTSIDISLIEVIMCLL